MIEYQREERAGVRTACCGCICCTRDCGWGSSASDRCCGKQAGQPAILGAVLLLLCVRAASACVHQGMTACVRRLPFNQDITPYACGARHSITQLCVCVCVLPGCCRALPGAAFRALHMDGVHVLLPEPEMDYYLAFAQQANDFVIEVSGVLLAAAASL